MVENVQPRYAYCQNAHCRTAGCPVKVRTVWQNGSCLAPVEALIGCGRHAPTGLFMGRSKRKEDGPRECRWVAPIMKLPARLRDRIVRRVCETLEACYGSPRHGNPRNALDDLIYIILSNKTTPAMATRIYHELKRRFPRWTGFLRARASTVERILRPAGLSRIKSKYIRSALAQIESDFGSCTLSRLKRLPTSQAEEYLTCLPGVSDKVAKCVLMYTCAAQVLPIDSHVHRVAKRLGWTVRKRADQCHAELEALVPPDQRYAFHVNCIAHGRAICRPAKPECEKCCINRYCFYYRGQL